MRAAITDRRPFTSVVDGAVLTEATAGTGDDSDLSCQSVFDHQRNPLRVKCDRVDGVEGFVYLNSRSRSL